MESKDPEIAEIVSMGVLESALNGMCIQEQEQEQGEGQGEGQGQRKEQEQGQVIEYNNIPLYHLKDAIAKMIVAARLDVSDAVANSIIEGTISRIQNYTTDTVPGHILFNAFADAQADANCGGYWDVEMYTE